MKKYKIDGVFVVDRVGRVYSDVDWENRCELGNNGPVGILACHLLERCGTEIKDPITYKPGDRFRYKDETIDSAEYMLVVTSFEDACEYGTNIGVLNVDTGIIVNNFSPKDHMNIKYNEFIDTDDDIIKVDDK